MVIKLDDIPIVAYGNFVEQVKTTLCDEQWRCLAYFAAPCRQGLQLYALLADNSTVVALSHIVDYYDTTELTSSGIMALQLFEREISELHGICFKGHPWGKPVRFPFNRFDRLSRIDNYPFYYIDSHELHLVNVGPVHAGVIEPGAFRFICNGEKILHLEIALGYQHRGVEHLICNTHNRLRQICIAESIAGDSAVAHSIAMSRLMGYEQPYFCIALELERIAMHLADIGALCTDIAYQLGQVACEALRTLTINTMQRWCGNRFGKGLIRPTGSNFPLSIAVCDDVREVITQVIERFATVALDIMSTPTLLARFEEICTVSRSQALAVGAVGMAAKSVGLDRDSRMFGNPHFVPCIETNGDLMSRLKLRIQEIDQSYQIIVKNLQPSTTAAPLYNIEFQADSLYFSMVEGWRGEIIHCGITDSQGEFSTYKIYDPSFHNWLMLALSVRGAQISDFPLSNKSYNLSYAGHDL